MSTYVLMKVLEAVPAGYDRGMRLLSRGAIDGVHAEIARRAAMPGARILDVGCGTGGVTIACAARGTHVVGIDRAAGMLAVARRKVVAAGVAERVELRELGAMEIEDRFPEQSFDAIVSCLVLSELTPEEHAYVLRTVRSRLRPGGRLVVADEVAAQTAAGRLSQRLRRAPGSTLAWLLARATTHPVADLEGLVRTAGLRVVASGRIGGDVALVEARRLEEGA